MLFVSPDSSIHVSSLHDCLNMYSGELVARSAPLTAMQGKLPMFDASSYDLTATCYPV